MVKAKFEVRRSQAMRIWSGTKLNYARVIEDAIATHRFSFSSLSGAGLDSLLPRPRLYRMEQIIIFRLSIINASGLANTAI